MADDQSRFVEVPQEMFEQNLSPQIQKVRRLVQHQQIRVVKQQGRQFDPSLPAAGQFPDGAFQVCPFQLELAGNFTASPFRLAAVADQEIEGRFTGLEWIMLAEVADSQRGVVNDLAPLQVFVAQQDPQQRRLSSTISPDETDFHVVHQ